MGKFSILAALSCVLSFQLAASHLIVSDSPEARNSVYQNCPEGLKTLRLLSVLPGMGWDNLMNENRAPVISQNEYKRCKVTKDGQFLIPDGVNVEMIKTTSISQSSEIYDSLNEYTDSTSSKINAEASFSYHGVGVSGSFSKEKSEVKNSKINQRSVAMRNQYRRLHFIATQELDAKLHPSFRKRLMVLAKLLKHSNMTDLRYTNAAYLADLMVRDFGTHVISTIDVGGSIIMVDYMDESVREMNSKEKNALSLTASVSFHSFLKLEASYSSEDLKEQKASYNENKKDSKTFTYGGSSKFVQGDNLQKWVDELEDNFVTIDRNGKPIYEVISVQTFPELSQREIYNLQTIIQGAILRYYKSNSIAGCTDPKSPNYNPNANILDDDSSACDKLKSGEIIKHPRIFSGFMRSQKMPCLPQTNELEFYDGFIDKERSIQHRHFEMQCKNPRLIEWCMPNLYQLDNLSGEQLHFWEKAVEFTVNSGYFFGGMFSKETVNPITNERSCPRGFDEEQVGDSISVCSTRDQKIGQRSLIYFGGIYTCSASNLLILHLEKDFQVTEATRVINLQRCPRGYTAYLAGYECGCAVFFCAIGIEKIIHFPTEGVKRPPFVVPNWTSDLEDDLLIPDVPSKASEALGKVFASMVAELKETNKLYKQLINTVTESLKQIK